jgi:hypothetical protein
MSWFLFKQRAERKAFQTSAHRYFRVFPNKYKDKRLAPIWIAFTVHYFGIPQHNSLGILLVPFALSLTLVSPDWSELYTPPPAELLPALGTMMISMMIMMMKLPINTL